ncbi:hypothetical protein DPEC_G00055440 [Dallia pectoralis]|uniref:Uncharacterized protein n=1 Tax=Dallia pectoralis TaxID=75939 RepID=A0ACC2H5X3_DALPE|nr:hypothetical protein DPEC_G00055440 [Dallia pectoralis]
MPCDQIGPAGQHAVHDFQKNTLHPTLRMREPPDNPWVNTTGTASRLLSGFSSLSGLPGSLFASRCNCVSWYSSQVFKLQHLSNIWNLLGPCDIQEHKCAQDTG